MPANTMLDTQILVSALQGVGEIDLGGCSIASTTALEFLGMLGGSGRAPEYYVPLPSTVAAAAYKQAQVRRDHPFHRRVTDVTLISFSTPVLSLRQYGHAAITQVINGRHLPLFRAAVDHLPKRKRERLLAKYRFITDASIQCDCLCDRAVAEAQTLLAEFSVRYQAKGDIENTINDMLIAATAYVRNKTLVTEDSLLSRHIAEFYGVHTHSAHANLEIRFEAEVAESTGRSRESREYINRNWTIHFRQNKAGP